MLNVIMLSLVAPALQLVPVVVKFSITTLTVFGKKLFGQLTIWSKIILIYWQLGQKSFWPKIQLINYQFGKKIVNFPFGKVQLGQQLNW
jgi:hypothetical protein